MGRGKANALRLDPRMEHLWILRHLRPDGSVTERVFFNREHAEASAARLTERRIRTRLYVADVEALTRLPDAPWPTPAAAADVAPVCHNSDDAESVESVAVGSPGGPAADLLDPAEVRVDTPADTPHSSRAGAVSLRTF